MADRTGLGRVARRLARGLRGPEKPLTVADRLDRWARRIAEFGVLDRPYLEAQTGRTFATDDEAISFYVHHDGQRGLSLNPLIEHEWMREHQPDPAMSWYDALHQEGPELFQTGPLFDAGVHASSLPTPDRPASTLDALRHFLRNATDATALPVPPGRHGDAPTWGAAHEAAMLQARAFAEAQRRTRRRYRSTWDGPDTAEVLARYARGAARRDAEQPLVSVVMPVHRRADVVGAAIDSVRAQQYGAWELVVVDDGSGDDTVDVVRRAAADEPRIRLIERENGGAGAARNTGLAAVRVTSWRSSTLTTRGGRSTSPPPWLHCSRPTVPACTRASGWSARTTPTTPRHPSRRTAARTAPSTTCSPATSSTSTPSSSDATSPRAWDPSTRHCGAGSTGSGCSGSGSASVSPPPYRSSVWTTTTCAIPGGCRPRSPRPGRRSRSPGTGSTGTPSPPRHRRATRPWCPSSSRCTATGP
ncbi:glycosyltransferase [Curtobacterium flaccumfaciens]|nr:glycosyltransferase [Curtobacterium flaccumfaciens]